MNIETIIEEISLENAATYLGYTYKYQRPVSKNHVSFLAGVMLDGLFDPTSGISFAVKDEEWILIDGQHTLHAIVKSGTKQTLPVKFYEVNLDDEIARLYSHFNIGRSRTFADSVRAYNIADLLDFKSSEIGNLAASLKYMKGGFPKGTISKRTSNENIIKLIEEWAEYGRLYFSLVMEGDPYVKGRMRNSASLSVFLVILRYQTEKGSEFIRELSVDNGLLRNDPRKTLHRYLLTITQNARIGGKSVQTNGQISRAVAKCWGKFYDGLTLQNIHINLNNANENIIIKGTPYTGKFPTVG